jgi:hypothetical protein
LSNRPRAASRVADPKSFFGIEPVPHDNAIPRPHTPQTEAGEPHRRSLPMAVGMLPANRKRVLRCAAGSGPRAAVPASAAWATSRKPVPTPGESGRSPLAAKTVRSSGARGTCRQRAGSGRRAGAAPFVDAGTRRRFTTGSQMRVQHGSRSGYVRTLVRPHVHR